MKALICSEYGPPETLYVGDLPDKPLQPREVRIAVKAASLNFPDMLMIEGKYQVKPPVPFSPGMECAGTILAVGRNVTQFRAGQRVAAVPGFGCFAEEAVALEDCVYPIPEDMAFVEAAAMPTTYGTAYYALAHRALLRSGETLLVLGAAGGVGISAIELGKALGATVIASASSAEKLAVAKSHGADHLIDSSAPDFRDHIRHLTGGRGADVILDSVGGNTFDHTLRCVAWNGRILVIGFASGSIPQIPANLILLKNCGVIGVFWGAHVFRSPEAVRSDFRVIFDLHEKGALRPRVSRTYSLAEVPAAMRAIQKRQAVGKLVVTIP